jgi:4'-phosphopantetheinyl transferase
MTPHWQSAPPHLVLQHGDVHLWRVPLGETREQWAAFLSPEESARASRFHFAHDRERFITGRAALRMILARYLGTAPGELQFAIGAHGKPELAGTCESLRFNLSHSGELMLLAITQAREIGIDLEQIRGGVPYEDLAERYFPDEEARSLRLLPEPEKITRFYELWTATEAQLKASGLGLANGTSIMEPNRWSLLSLTPAADYRAALAVERGPMQLSCWSWLN